MLLLAAEYRLADGQDSGAARVLLKIIANAQKIHLIAQEMLECKFEPVQREAERILEAFPNGMECCYYNIEQAFDKIHAESLGVDTDRLELVESKELEVVGEIMHAGMEAFHLHVIDSVNEAVPLDAKAAEITDWQRGLNARVWSKVLDRVEDSVEEGENTVILIDQVRIDQNFGGQKVSGGERLKHVSSMTIHFKHGKELYRQASGKLDDTKPKNGDNFSGEADSDAYIMHAHVKKSRVGTAQRKANVIYEYKRKGVDRLMELAKASYWLGFVEVGGSWFTLPDGTKVQGVNKLMEAIDQDVQLQKQIQDKIYQYYYENP
jgi:recombination protein RecA